MTPDHQYEDLKGRLVWKFQINNYMVDLSVDHPMKSVVVLEIAKFR